MNGAGTSLCSSIGPLWCVLPFLAKPARPTGLSLCKWNVSLKPQDWRLRIGKYISSAVPDWRQCVHCVPSCKTGFLIVSLYSERCQRKYVLIYSQNNRAKRILCEVFFQDILSSLPMFWKGKNYKEILNWHTCIPAPWRHGVHCLYQTPRAGVDRTPVRVTHWKKCHPFSGHDSLQNVFAGNRGLHDLFVTLRGFILQQNWALFWPQLFLERRGLSFLRRGEETAFSIQ